MRTRPTIPLCRAVVLAAVLGGASLPAAARAHRSTTTSSPRGLVPLAGASPKTPPRSRPGCVAPKGKPAQWGQVRRIRLQGAPGEARGPLRKAIHLKAGKPFNRHTVARDVHRLWSLGTLRAVWVEACRSGADVEVTYHVKQNPRVRRIRIHLKHPSRKRWLERTLAKLWRVRPGARLSRKKLLADLRGLRSEYKDRGFWRARLEPFLRPISADVADVVLRIRTGPRVMTRSVRFEGNRALSAKALRKVMETQPVTAFRDDVLNRDYLRLRALYYDHGYISVTLDEPRKTLSKDHRFLDVTIKVHEKHRYRLGRISFRGELLAVDADGRTRLLKDPKAPAYRRAQEQLRKLAKSRMGQVFSRSKLRDDLLRLNGWYRNRGYAEGEATPVTNIHMSKRTIDLTLELKAGRLYTIERVRVTGQRKVHEAVIRSLTGLRPGDRFSMKKLQSTYRRLVHLGFFKSVRVTTRRGSAADRLLLTVEVKER